MFTRRNVLAFAGASLGAWAFAAGAQAEKQPRKAKPAAIAGWMDQWMKGEKALGAPLRISRFRDPMYFLLAPISWTPNLAQLGKYQAVEVPTGFVTDFASIPDVFFSLLRPDGEYAYAAVVHDYLYWTQTRPREEADEIFQLAMQDLDVGIVKATALYQAVHRFGGKAWSDNARLRQGGEKRILAKFPDQPTINWKDWKKRADVFTP